MEPRQEASALQFLPAASTKSPGEEAPWELAAHCGENLSYSSILSASFYLGTIPVVSATLVLVPGSN